MQSGERFEIGAQAVGDGDTVLDGAMGFAPDGQGKRPEPAQRVTSNPSTPGRPGDR